MKNLLGTRHVLVGVITALFTGLLWVAMLRRFGHASLDSIKPWILPLVVIMTIIGLSVGLVGKRNGNTPLKVFFSTLFGTGLSSFAMIPLTVIVVLPLGKLAEALGLVNRATMPDDVATTLVYTAMIIIWLIVGTAISTLFLRVAIRKSEQKIPQMPSPDHGLQKSSVIYVRAHG